MMYRNRLAAVVLQHAPCETECIRNISGIDFPHFYIQFVHHYFSISITFYEKKKKKDEKRTHQNAFMFSWRKTPSNIIDSFFFYVYIKIDIMKFLSLIFCSLSDKHVFLVEDFKTWHKLQIFINLMLQNQATKYLSAVHRYSLSLALYNLYYRISKY